jgi:hypothetical protein
MITLPLALRPGELPIAKMNALSLHPAVASKTSYSKEEFFARLTMH